MAKSLNLAYALLVMVVAVAGVVGTAWLTDDPPAAEGETSSWLLVAAVVLFVVALVASLVV